MSANVPNDTNSVSISVHVAGRPSTTANAIVVDLATAERTRRAAKYAGICVAIGVLTLAIPIVHFVAPWVMLVIAAYVWRRIQGQRAELISLTAACPACGAEVILPRQPAVWPIEWNCPQCRKRISFQPIAVDPPELSP